MGTTICIRYIQEIQFQFFCNSTARDYNIPIQYNEENQAAYFLFQDDNQEILSGLDAGPMPNI